MTLSTSCIIASELSANSIHKSAYMAVLLAFFCFPGSPNAVAYIIPARIIIGTANAIVTLKMSLVNLTRYGSFRSVPHQPIFTSRVLVKTCHHTAHLSLPGLITVSYLFDSSKA